MSFSTRDSCDELSLLVFTQYINRLWSNSVVIFSWAEFSIHSRAPWIYLVVLVNAICEEVSTCQVVYILVHEVADCLGLLLVLLIAMSQLAMVIFWSTSSPWKQNTFLCQTNWVINTTSNLSYDKFREPLNLHRLYLTSSFFI